MSSNAKFNIAVMSLIAALVVLCLFLLFTGGCCHIEYPIFDPNCGKVAYAKYDRWFNQEITEFRGAKDPNGVFSVSFDKQKSATELAFEAFNMGVKVGQSK